MQLYRLKSYFFGNTTFLIIAFSLLCSSCNEKPVFKGKHYTSKRVVRNYKRNDSLLATAETRDVTDQKKNTIPHKPIETKKPKVASKIKTPDKKIKEDPKVKLITRRQNKYFIIAASYTDEFKAIELALEYIELGFPVEIISSNNKFRVTLHSERSKRKAVKLRDSLRIKLKRKDFWLLRY